MESTFLEWLNSIRPGLGITLAVLIFGGGLVITTARGIIKFKKWYYKKVQDNINKEKADQEFKARMTGLSSQINSLSDTVENLVTYQKNHNDATDNKIDELHKSVRQEGERSNKGDANLLERITKYEKLTNGVIEKIDDMASTVDLLVMSDKEDIKSFITNEYYQCMSQGYVEIYKFKVLEERYSTYLKENGNSFIEGLMNEIRNLPKGSNGKQSNPKSDMETIEK